MPRKWASCIPLVFFVVVNDSIIFSRVTVEDFEAIKNFLDIYERASRHKVNMEKSAIIFNPNVH